MQIKIMLDAGHYGKYNRSPVVPEYWESEGMWTLHLYLKKELEAYGFEVGTTREKQDVDLEVTQRGRSAKGYDLLLSLHSNAADTETVDRVVGIYQLPDERFSFDETSKEIAELLADTVTAVMDTRDKPKCYYRESANDRDRDGKLNDNYYGILHGARMVETTAVIIEHSFHTNKRATEWLLNDDNLKTLATAEAKVLAHYYGLLPEQRKKGDVNGDGKIDSKDFIITKRIFLGTYKPTAEEFWAADIDGDGFIGPKDYLLLKRHVIGTYKIEQPKEVE